MIADFLRNLPSGHSAQVAAFAWSQSPEGLPNATDPKRPDREYAEVRFEDQGEPKSGRKG